MSLPVTYLFGIALVVLVGLFWVLRRVQFNGKEPIRSILDLAAIPSLRQSLPDLILEVARARRLSHTLSLVVVRAQFPNDQTQHGSSNVKYFKKEGTSAVNTRQLDLQEFSNCSRAFRDLLREVDCVAFDSVRDQFIVILPGSTHSQAVETINRISKHLGPDIANRLTIGTAEYPKDGLFLEDLIEFGMGQLNDEVGSLEVEVEARA